MLRTAAALFFVVILAACTSSGSSQLPDADFFVGAGQLFALRVGDTAGVVTTTAIVLVRFGAVLNDSRCPVDVECVQAGSATVLLSVQTALDVQDVTLEVPPEGGVELEVNEVTLDLIELRPPTRSGVTIDPLSYVTVMRVRETGSILP